MSDETTSPDAPPRRLRRGSYLVMMAFLMVVLMGATAYAVDLAVLHLAHQQLRSGVDGAALAGASHLDGTTEGMNRAAAAAIATGAANLVRREALELESAHLEYGVWDHEARSYTTSTDPDEVNAIRVARTVAEVPTPFAGVFMGTKSMDVQAEAIAVRPLPEPVAESDCFLPIAVPKCVVDGLGDGSGTGVLHVQLSNDSNDNAGWAHPGGANASNVSAAIRAAANGQCANGGPTVGEGDGLPVQNGVTASVLRQTRDSLRLSALNWDGDLWGAKPPRDEHSSLTLAQYPTAGIIQGPIPVVNAGGACGSAKFNQTMPIDHLAWGVIFDVYNGPGQHKGVQILFDFEHEFETPGNGSGTGSGNVVARPPGRLVR